MAVTSAKEIHYGREGGDSNESRYEADLVRCFRVITDNVYDGAGTVLDYSTIPQPSEQHSDYPDLYVARRRAVNDSKSKKIWIATITYKSFPLGRSENPLAVPVEITWSTESETRPVFVDKDGSAILNSAGDYYEDGVQGEFSNWTIRMKKNLAFVPQWILTYQDAINSDGVWIDGVYIAPRMAKISSISIGNVQIQGSIRFRSVEIGVKLKTSWAASVLDQGLHELYEDGLGGTYPVPVRYVSGEKPGTPVLLDGSGSRLDSPTPATAVFNTHYIYQEKPFSYFLY